MSRPAPRPASRPAPREVVLILGNPRSGSTLLGAMLGAHSQAAFLGEMNRYPEVLRALRGPGPRARTCLICEGACPVWDAAVPAGFARRYGRAARLGAAVPFGRGFYGTLFEATGARVLVDSSKTAAWAARRLAERRDWRAARAHLVLITRDGRGTLASWMRKRPGAGADALAERWAGNVRDVLAAHAAFDPARRAHVRYEDLVADPDAALAGLCAALDLPFEPGMAAYWRREHHVFAGNFGTLSLIARWRHEAGLRGPPALEVARDQSLYREAGYAVFDDQRWRDELSAADLAAFERRAGALNRALGHGG